MKAWNTPVIEEVKFTATKEGSQQWQVPDKHYLDETDNQWKWEFSDGRLN